MKRKAKAEGKRKGRTKQVNKQSEIVDGQERKDIQIFIKLPGGRTLVMKIDKMNKP